MFILCLILVCSSLAQLCKAQYFVFRPKDTCQSPLPLQLHVKYPLFHIMNSHFNFDFKFQSLNVRGLNKSIKRRSIFRWLHNQKYHFTFLQETYSSIQHTRIWEAEWGGKVFFSHGASHSKGVMTLINPTLDFKVELKSICEKNGRLLILDLIVDDTHLVLVNIYAPNDAKQQIGFFKALQKKLTEFAQENIIIAGDFNCASTDKDKKGGNSVSRKALVIKEIEHLASLYNLTDIWRDRNPHREGFTWTNKLAKIQCRLDFFPISKILVNEMFTCETLNAPETDHSVITLYFKSDSARQPSGPGFCKFNNSLLEEHEYSNRLRENIALSKTSTLMLKN